MSSTRRSPWLATSLVTLALMPGCGSLFSIVEPNGRPHPYMGTSVDLTAMMMPSGPFRVLAVVDLPLSFLFDTVLLPYTVPQYLFGDLLKR